jgi:hypothetical protein
MIIDEQDLFNFVFFPEKVSEEKRKLLDTDKSFSEAIEFYNQLKLNSERELTSSVKKKLAEKIPAYKLRDMIELYHLNILKPQNQNGSRMAAATKELIPKTTTKTFVDSDKDYLIKVLNYGNETKIFVFSTKDEEVKNFDIVIEPQNLKYHFEDNSEPLIINQSVDAEKIQLKFN